MSEIEVRMTGDQEASDGVVELWHGGEQIAFTHYDPHDGHLLLRIDPRSDGEPLRVAVRGLRDALEEAERLLAS
ncbi:MAG TPA: hypothetical protein VGE91_00750 [Solirubrobacterales bacterium]|jgi:hypothetical protein